MTKKVAPVPRGYRTATPTLVIRGVAHAIEFYKSAYGAEDVRRLESANGGYVLHAEIKIGNSPLFLVEENPAGGLYSPAWFGGTATITHLYVDDVDQFTAGALANGAVEVMPATDTYWGDRMAKLADPFGHLWSVASRVEKLSPEEVAGRAARLTVEPLPEETVSALAA